MTRHHGRRWVSLALSVAVVVGLTSATAEARNGRDARTFENDRVGTVPAGCSTPAGATAALVSDARAHRGRHSLRVEDRSTATNTVVRCPADVRRGATMSFFVRPARLDSGFLFSLLGHVEGVTDEQPVFHFNVTPAGAVRWYDRAGWTQITPAGTVAMNRWTKLTVEVPRDRERAWISADGRYVGEAGGWGVRAITDITGYQFTGNGTATTGDDVYVDDVRVEDGNRTASPVRQPFTVGKDVTVDTSDEPMQMPNTAVTVDIDGQTQTLVSYPAHSDASDTAGNEMAVTTDRGRTWQDAQQRNPMPDAPSFGLTKLANGDVLAVDYHTYMTPDSGNLKAEVPTAISHDGGRTWTQRSGVMTAPQAMRPIADVTDRPGSPLGGFVLVHSVVEDPDGTLYQSGYGYYAGEKKYRQIVIRSTDGGVNWTVASTVAYDPDLSSDPRFEGFDEGALERLSDGSLLIVMRTGSYQQMYTSRSYDNASTWTRPEPLDAGPNDLPVVGIYPTLERMPDGRLVLWIGRPGQRLLVSDDGLGRHWTTPQAVDYRNSGNGTFIAVGRNQLLTFGDRGADWANPTPTQYRVWSRLVTVN